MSEAATSHTRAARPTVLLLSSDLRRRYAEDILTALALPTGAIIQFRYGREYVAGSLREWIASGRVIGERTLLAFVAEMESDRPFVVPVRFATVTGADSIADFVVLQLRVEAYANLRDYPPGEPEIRSRSRRLLDALVEANGGYYPAVLDFPDFGTGAPGDSAQLWANIVRRLAQHRTFWNCYFLRIDSLKLQDGRAVRFDADGRLVFTEQQSAKLIVTLYSQQYSREGRKALTCRTDGTFVRVSSDESYDVALRYDLVEFWLQPVQASFDALGRVTVQLRQEVPSDDDAPAPTARFPILVKASRSLVLVRALATGAGAAMVALPAILGPSMPEPIRITVGLAGVLLLTSSTFITRRPGDAR